MLFLQTTIFISVFLLLMSFEKSFSQNCTDVSVSKLNDQVIGGVEAGGYELVDQINSILQNNSEHGVAIQLESDFTYEFVLVCPTGTKATGIEIDNSDETMIDYTLNTSGTEKNIATLDFNCDFGGTYLIKYKMLSGSAKTNCSYFSILRMEKTISK